jgi:hypothetical protein
MEKCKLIGKISGIVLILVLIGAMLGGLPVLLSEAQVSIRVPTPKMWM